MGGHALREDGLGNLSDLAALSVKGLYGWEGTEGTDERVWNGTAPEERTKLLRITALRLIEQQYHGRVFRRTLLTVIKEQSEADHDPDLWKD